MQVTTKITVDMTRQNVGQRINAVQGDGNTRLVEITLLSGGAPWTPPEGVEAAIAYMQPGGTKGLYNKLADGTAAISISGNVATVILAPQMLTTSGTVQASLMFSDAQLNRLTTFPFSVSVTSNPAVGAQKVEDYLRLQWLEDKLGEYLRKAADSGAFDGKPGDNGVTFTPSVSENGDLSWRNNGGLPNPQTVNIQGQQGDSTAATAAANAAQTSAANAETHAADAAASAAAAQAAADAMGTELSQIKDDIVDCHYIEKDISGSVVIVDSNVINPVLSAKDNITVLHTGKNLVSVPYDDPTGSSHNVMFTIAENGMLHVNGTATGTAVHNFVKSNQANRRPIKAGTYTLSGCPAGGGTGVYMLTIGITGVGEFNDFGDGVTFTILNDTTYYLKFKVYNGTTVDFDVKAQLEMSSEKTHWEQYKHENISVGSTPVSILLYQGINILSSNSDFNLSAKVKKRKTPIINLRDYVVGDGETDDTNAINEALIKATNGILYVPSGTYLFSGTLHIHSGTKVIGCGENSVFKLSNDFELDAISWRPDTYNALYKYPMIAFDEDSTGCELRNFALVGQNINWKDENEDGIMVQGSNHILENLVIHDINYSNENFTSRWCLCPAWGIDIFKANTISVRNCHVYNCGYENIGTEESETVTISDCKFGDACQTSTQIHRLSKHIKFYGNTVYHTENIRSENCPAFTMDASIGVDMDDIVVSNNTFGSHVNTVAGGENNIRIIGNRIVGIMYTNTTDNYASGLIISNNQIKGRINMRADNVIVSNNIINNDTEMPMARIYGNNVEMNGNLGIGVGKSTTIVEH